MKWIYHEREVSDESILLSDNKTFVFGELHCLTTVVQFAKFQVSVSAC